MVVQEWTAALRPDHFVNAQIAIGVLGGYFAAEISIQKNEWPTETVDACNSSTRLFQSDHFLLQP
jgi:hypothetical protein